MREFDHEEWSEKERASKVPRKARPSPPPKKRKKPPSDDSEATYTRAWVID